jgi:heme A synthase
MKTAGRVRRPGPLGVFAVAFTLLLAAAACVGVGNFRPNTTLLPVISFYLSGAAVVLTVVALLLPARRAAREDPQEP